MVAPKKSLGQHWLFDQSSLEAMVSAAEIGRGDDVLEIGPGLGTLTDRLLQAGANVTAVEFDQRLAGELQDSFEGYIIEHRLTVHNEDILKFDLTTLPANYKVAANIPYYLTSNLLRVLSEASNPPSVIALLIQKEVAERVAAKPGDMSLLSVTTQWYFEPKLGPVVGAELFTPPPKVDSQILTLVRREQPLFPNVDTRHLFRLVKAGFGERRKKLRSSLSSGLRLEKSEVEAKCKAAGIDPNLRAQALSLADWNALQKEFAA